MVGGNHLDEYRILSVWNGLFDYMFIYNNRMSEIKKEKKTKKGMDEENFRRAWLTCARKRAERQSYLFIALLVMIVVAVLLTHCIEMQTYFPQKSLLFLNILILCFFIYLALYVWPPLVIQGSDFELYRFLAERRKKSEE